MKCRRGGIRFLASLAELGVDIDDDDDDDYDNEARLDPLLTTFGDFYKN